MDITEILKRAKPPETVIDLCLDADLAAEHDDLNRQLQEQHRAGAVTMADTTATGDLARKIRDLEERMQASVVTFRMRAMSPYKFQEWRADHPGREGKEELFNPVTGLAPMIAACAVDPAMTVDQARELCEALGTGQADRLFNAAWSVTTGQGSVPFSAAASATLRASEQKQK